MKTIETISEQRAGMIKRNQAPPYTTTERDNLDATDGMIIWNTTTDRANLYQDGDWTVPTMNTDVTLAGNNYFLDEDAMGTDSNTKVASQQSVKAYVDSGTVTMTNKTLTSPVLQGDVDGWVGANETWTYASATTITVPSGAASTYQKGDKIKLTQTTVKYFYIVGVADTVLTVTGGTDYTVANAAISLNYYSKVENPQGFPGWFDVTTPTWDVATFDNGAGGQPTTSEYRMSVNGRLVTLHCKANGIKAGTAKTCTFPTSSLPINETNYTDQSTFGNCYCSSGTQTGSVIINVTTVYLHFVVNIADNATISNLAFTMHYEI